MKRKIVSAIAVAAFLSLGSGAAESQWSIDTGLRMHARVLDEAGQLHEVTLLTRSRGRDEAKGAIKRHAVLLIEGGSAGRWVYESDCTGTLDFSKVTVTSTLRQVGGSPALSVEYTTSEGEGKGSYVVQTPEGTKAFHEPDLASVPPAGNSELLDRLSASSKEVLHLLRALAHDKGSWHVEKTFLDPFFGSENPGPATTLQVQALPVDCTWDAAFGFPCEDGERPSGEGKVYVKKLSP